MHNICMHIILNSTHHMLNMCRCKKIMNGEGESWNDETFKTKKGSIGLK
jgi:hypothetical protein